MEATSLTHRSRGRPPVPIDRIVAMALQIVDEGGASALSMRGLAQRLGTGTATIYRHVADRDELTALVVERVLEEAELSARVLKSKDWRLVCRTTALSMFDSLSRHRNIAPLLTGQVPVGANALAIRERCIAALRSGGFSPRNAARAWAMLAHFVLGFAMQLGGREDDARAGRSSSPALFGSLDPKRYPATASVAHALPVPLEDEFAFGLDLIIDGLGRLSRARVAQGKPRRRTSR